MKKVLIVILPFIVYFGLGWLAKDIYFYFNEITVNTTMNKIYEGEIIAVSSLCCAYNLTCEFIGKESTISNILWILPLIFGFIFALLPMSIFAVILNCILSLATMILAGFVSFK